MLKVLKEIIHIFDNENDTGIHEKQHFVKILFILRSRMNIYFFQVQLFDLV